MNASQIVVKLQLHLGKEEERLDLFLETMSVFDMVDCTEDELTESFLKQECLPVALAKLKETVKEVSGAYGLPSMDLIHFGEDFNI